MSIYKTARTIIVDYIKYIRLGREQSVLEDANKIVPEKTDDWVNIAFYPTGGLGDYIISSKLADELLTYGSCKIDVFCENVDFGKAIYEKRKGMRVIPYSMYEASLHLYDVAMKVEHFVHIESYNAKRLMDITPELFKRVEYITVNWDRLYLPIEGQCYRERIHFEQMKLKGLNRYTELRMGDAFKIDDCWTDVCLTDEGKEIFNKELADKKYITFNYGADAMNSKNKMQLKVWPAEYYSKLFTMLKMNYPDIEIVQLGGKKSKKINYADKYILGESLESTKWILKNSLCHIDCEGGLVHLATQLKTHCIVIFGPTPLHLYGYPQNTNLVSDECSNCMGIHPEWAFECFRGDEKPRCMYGITPEIVYEKFTAFYQRSELHT